MKNIVVFIVCLLTWALAQNYNATQETTLSISQQYSAGTRLHSPWTGVSFTIPENHIAYFDVDFGGFVIVTQDNSNILAIEAASTAQAVDLGFYAIEALAKFALPNEEEPNFQLISSPQQQGNTLTAKFLIGEDIVVSVAAQQGAAGNSAVIIGYGPQAEQIIQMVNSSLNFTQPNSEVAKWQQQLSGLNLSAGKSNSDFSGSDQYNQSVSYAGKATFVYDFCSDGRFQHEYNDIAYVSISDTGYMMGSFQTGSKGAYQGTWYLISLLTGNPLLILETDQDEIFMHFIEESPEGAFIGDRFFEVSQSQLCR